MKILVCISNVPDTTSKINFKKSITDLEECKYYVLETKVNLQDSEVEIKYCEKDKKSFVSKIEKSFY